MRKGRWLKYAGRPNKQFAEILVHVALLCGLQVVRRSEDLLISFVYRYVSKVGPLQPVESNQWADEGW